MTAPSHHPEDRPVGRRLRPADRALAEAVRFYEHDGAAILDEPAADQRAREAGGAFERRIVDRAASLAIAGELRSVLRHIRRATNWIILVALVVALLSGGAAARGALGASGGEPVNFFWILLSLIGVQTLLILLWVILAVAAPRSINVSPIGGAVMAAARWVTARVERSATGIAALRAFIAVNAGGAAGRWTVGAISHAMWSAFNLGCIVLLIALLAAREYVFTWETTILSADSYARITQAIAVVPDALGFETPTVEDVEASELGQPIEELLRHRVAWSHLLIGSMIAYAFAPRVLLLVFCLVMRGRALRRARLDTTAPGYQRLRARLIPAAEREGVIGRAPSPAVDRMTSTVSTINETAPAPTGPPAILGVEIDPPDSAWPPRLHDVRWVDLGFVDSREDRRRALDELASLPDPPCLAVAVCSLTTTPDRGIGAFLEQLRTAARGHAAVLLTRGHALRQRGDEQRLIARIDDWRKLALNCGIQSHAVLELDLDHLTAESAKRLATLIGTNDDAQERDDARLDRAFESILDAARRWSGAPDWPTQARLHRTIAGIYRGHTTWPRDLLRLPANVTTSLPVHVRSASHRVVDLLPGRLRRSPRWLAAGAMTGALGCVAAAMLISPVAIGALPVWSAIGAAVAAVVQPSRSGEAPVQASKSAEAEFADAVRAAAMFAMLLELQGRDEATITRVLDRTIDEADEPPLKGADDCPAWLASLRGRFDDALAREAG